MQLTPLSPNDLFLQMLASAGEYLHHKFLSFCPLKVKRHLTIHQPLSIGVSNKKLLFIIMAG